MNKAHYIETDCKVTFQGRTFESGGAMITDDFIIGYPTKDGRLLNWNGTELLGHIRITGAWPAVFFGKRSWMGEHLFQIEVKTLDGVFYTGRGFGSGMLYRGKRKATQAYKDMVYPGLYDRIF